MRAPVVSWWRKTGTFATLYLVSPLAALPWWLAYTGLSVYGYQHRLYAIVAVIGGVITALGTWTCLDQRLFATKLMLTPRPISFSGHVKIMVTTRGSLSTRTSLSTNPMGSFSKVVKLQDSYDVDILLSDPSPSLIEFKTLTSSRASQPREEGELLALSN